MSLFTEFPLLKRELVGILRTPRAFWLLVLTVCLSSFVTLAVWPGREESVRDYTKNVELFRYFTFAQLSVCLLVIPLVTGDSIAGERERNTYESLRSSLLSPLSLVLSKLFASVGYLILVIVASAPLLFVLYFLGGIGLGTVLKCLVVILATVVSTGIVCLTASLRSRSTVRAVLRGTLWMILYNTGLLPLVLGGFVFFVFCLGGVFAMFALGLSPYPAIHFAIHPDQLPVPFAPWLVYLGYSLCISGIHFWYLLRKLRGPDAFVTGERTVHTGLTPAPRMRAVQRPYLVRLLIRLGHRGLWPFSNVFFQKEIRTEFSRRVYFGVALFWFGGAAFLILVGRGKWFSVSFVGHGALGLTTLVVLGSAASCFPREVERNTLDLLRTTLVSMRETVLGKFFAALVSGVGIVAGAGCAILLSVVFAAPWSYWDVSGRLHALGLYLLVAVVTLCFAGALGCLAGVLSRRSTTALLVTYLSAFALFLVVPLLAELVFAGRPPAAIKLILTAVNPFLTFDAGLAAIRSRAVSTFELFGVVACFLAVQGLASWGCLYGALRLVDRLRARDA